VSSQKNLRRPRACWRFLNSLVSPHWGGRKSSRAIHAPSRWSSECAAASARRGCRRNESEFECCLRERVGCSSLVDWPVYPRLIRGLCGLTCSRATVGAGAVEAGREEGGDAMPTESEARLRSVTSLARANYRDSRRPGGARGWCTAGSRSSSHPKSAWPPRLCRSLPSPLAPAGRS
jgi:hypothetical protein